VIFVLGMFWSRATTAGAFVGAVGSVALSVAYKFWAPEIPLMNRVGYVFLICFAAAIAGSLVFPRQAQASTTDVTDVDYSTSWGFNIASVIVVGILVFLYATFW